jgi:hypothetical protein
MAFDNFEEYISPEQEQILDGLFMNSNNYYNIDVEELASLEREFFDNLGGLTSERAQEIIDYLNENKIEMDLDKQFNNRFL